MKKIIFTLLFVATTLATWAIPAKPGLWKTITLKNGTEIQAQLKGDEHAHYWQDANGTCYQEDPLTGLFTAVSPVVLQSRANARRAQVNSIRYSRMRRARANKSEAFTGTKKGLIILVQFNNKKFKAGANAKALFNNVANTEGYSQNGFSGSVRDYFKAQSFNEFVLDFDVVGPYTLNHDFSYYGANDSNGDDKRPGEMVKDALEAADAEVDFRDYDWDGDGEVEQVYVLYAGPGEASGGSTSTIWPHEWELSASDVGTSLVFDGVILDTYACGNEVSGSSYDGIGTLCHEFSHCLGYPDVYDTNYGGNFGMGGFDLMDRGSYNDDGFTPAGYTSYERWIAGWLEPIVLTTDTVISNLKPINAEGGAAFIVYNQAHPDEYYLVENRQKTGYDAYIPSAGLMVTHIDYDEWVWYFNMVNTEADYSMYASSWGAEWAHAKNDHPRMTPIPSYKSSYWSGSSVYTYPYGANDSLTKSSSPATTLYNKNSDGTKYMNCGFLNIKQNNDKTVSFNFRGNGSGSSQGGGQGGGGGETPIDGVLFYESFDKCTGTGGNDGKWNGSIATGAIHTDNEGWTFSNAKGASKCLKCGTSNVVGVVTTPAITIDGEVTLTFRAGAWDNSKDGTTLLLGVNGNATLGKTNFTMLRGEWTEYTTTITGQGEVHLTFTPDNRFFLDEVKIIANTTTGISDLQLNTRTGTQRIYSINGQYLGTNLDILPHGIYVVNGKKIVK